MGNIDERKDKSRLKCPHCGAFIAEIKPCLEYGQSVVAKCPRCRNEAEIKKEYPIILPFGEKRAR